MPTNWQRWGYCPTCDSPAGKPCLDLRYARNNRLFRRDRPHRDRERPNNATANRH